MKQKTWYYAIFILLSAILLCLYLWNLSKYNQPAVLSDEYGYWSIAALFSGYNWSGLITSMSYYSFGYSLLLTPFVNFISNMVTAYQLAVLLNAIFGFLSFLLLNQLLQTLDKKKHNLWIVFASFAAMCYPCVQVYTKVAWSETLILTLYLLLSYLVLRQIKKPSYLKTLGIGLVLCYLFWVHQRTLVILLAVFAVYFYVLFKNQTYIRHIILLGCVTVLGFCANEIIKGFLMKQLWHQSTHAYDNDFAGQIDKLIQFLTTDAVLWLIAGSILLLILTRFFHKLYSAFPKNRQMTVLYGLGIFLLLFSITSVCVAKNMYYNNHPIFAIGEMNGISRLLLGIMGKIFYMLSSSYFLAAWGIGYLIHLFLHKAAQEEKVIALFFILSIGGSFLLNVFSNYQCARADSVLYGRYSEYTLIPVIALGVLYFIHIEKRSMATLFLASFYCLSGLCTAMGISKLGLSGSNNLINTTGLPELYTATDFQSIYNAGTTVLFVYGAFLILLYYIHCKKKCVLIIIGSLSILWSVNARTTENVYLLCKQSLQKQYSEPVIAYLENHDRKNIYYVLTGNVKDMWAYGMQFSTKNSMWNYVELEALANVSGDAYIVTIVSSKEATTLEQQYENILKTEFYTMYYLP